MAIHIRYAQCRFLDDSTLTPEPNTIIPLSNGQLIET
jgi:hypothetical protein